MKRLGVVTPVVTPCSLDGKIDLAGLKSVCDYLMKGGCHGIFACGSTGRGPWFSRNEQMKVLESVRRAIGPDKPLWAGCMASGLPAMMDNAIAARDSGASAAVFTSPFYFSYNQEELGAIFQKFADKSPIPVVIYDIPAFAGVKLNEDLIVRLSRHENIIGFKDSSADMPRFKALIDSLDVKSDFYLLQGKEHLLIDSVQAGASGFIVSLVHVNPKLFVSLYNAAVVQDMKKAHEYQKLVSELMSIVVACLQGRPEMSTMFFILDSVLKAQSVCKNILLEHEKTCPEGLLLKIQEIIKWSKMADSLI